MRNRDSTRRANGKRYEKLETVSERKKLKRVNRREQQTRTTDTKTQGVVKGRICGKSKLQETYKMVSKKAAEAQEPENQNYEKTL